MVDSDNRRLIRDGSPRQIARARQLMMRQLKPHIGFIPHGYGYGYGDGYGYGYGNHKTSLEEKMDGLGYLAMHGRWGLLAEVKDFGSELHLTKVNCVRRWGTSRGVGQLVTEGPTELTKMDPEPDQIVDRIQVIRFIPCNMEKWSNYGA